MKSVEYFIDKTENGYISFEGKSLDELKDFLYCEGEFGDCCGTIVCKWDARQVYL